MDTGKKKVLMVEDDLLLSELLAGKLSEKFQLLQAQSGEAALDILRTTIPDLIFLDIRLPGIDGFEVLRRIKEDPKTAGIRVVILSNFGEEEDIKKGKELGADEYVVKVSLLPNEIVALADKISAREKPAVK